MALRKRMGPVKPAPFKRKSISITLEPGKRRSWKRVAAVMVEIGDTIAEFGLVEDIGQSISGRIVTLVNMHGEEKKFLITDEVLAFK